MDKILMLAALAEAGTGVALLADPQIVIQLLIGVEIVGAGIIMSRLAGIAVIGLGAACWPGTGTRPAFQGMVTYSTLAMLYLIYIGVRGESAGFYCGQLLWPMRFSQFFSYARESKKKKRHRYKYLKLINSCSWFGGPHFWRPR